MQKNHLEAEFGRRLEELENMKKRHREEETKLEHESTTLSEKLDNLGNLPPILNCMQMYSQIITSKCPELFSTNEY